MRRLPFLLAHVECAAARGASPVDAAGRLAGHEAAILPELLAGAGPPTPVQSVDHRRGDAARLENEARHAFGQRARLPAGVLSRPDLALVRSPGGHSIIRCAS